MANVKVSPPRVVLRWGNHCHRHPDAYGSQFEKTSFGGRFASSFAFFACSGATTENNVRTDSTGDEPGWGEYAQVNRPELDSATELVTLTAGGNDLRFPAVMRDCHVFFGYCSSDIKNEVNSKVTSDAFRRDLYLTYKAIKSTTGPHTTIVVMGYPQLFPDEFGDYLGETGQNCENLLGYNPADMDWMNGVVDLQNAALQEAASAGGVFLNLPRILPEPDTLTAMRSAARTERTGSTVRCRTTSQIRPTPMGLLEGALFILIVLATSPGTRPCFLPISTPRSPSRGRSLILLACQKTRRNAQALRAHPGCLQAKC